MAGLDDLYQELILDHYRRPRHRGTLAHPAIIVDQHNPLCGDELHVTVCLDGDRITEIAHTGEGCSISQASASMMSDAIVGHTTGEALELIEHFRQVMHREVPADEDQLGDAVALEGVNKYPVRIKCALLSWMALKDGLLTRMLDQQESR
jgi:nitrogen fixation protein NifU and related proteins